MKYLLSVVVVVSVTAFSFIGASAGPLQATSTPPPTATITSAPAYVPSISPIDSNSFNCGAGTPAGWGTLTPEAAWGLLCGQCMPETDLAYTPVPPAATVTPYAYYCGGDDTVATPTGPDCLPVYGGTATPVPTISPTPSGCGDLPLITPDEYTGDAATSHTQSIDCFDESTSTKTCEGTLDSTWTGAPYGGAVVCVPFKVYVSADFDMYIRGTIYDDSTNIYYPAHTKLSNGCLVDGVGDTSWYHFSGPDVLEDHHATNTNWFGDTYAGYRTVWMVTANGGTSAGFPGTTLHLHFKLTFSTGASCLDDSYMTPVPSSTPPVPGYCEVVNGGGTELASDDISWNGIIVYPGSCIDIGPWDAPFPSLSDFGSAPWIAHLCFSEVDLGVIKAFGVSISLLAIAYIGAIAWALRNLFIS